MASHNKPAPIKKVCIVGQLPDDCRQFVPFAEQQGGFQLVKTATDGTIIVVARKGADISKLLGLSKVSLVGVHWVKQCLQQGRVMEPADHPYEGVQRVRGYVGTQKKADASAGKYKAGQAADTTQDAAAAAAHEAGGVFNIIKSKVFDTAEAAKDRVEDAAAQAQRTGRRAVDSTKQAASDTLSTAERKAKEAKHAAERIRYSNCEADATAAKADETVQEGKEEAKDLKGLQVADGAAAIVDEQGVQEARGVFDGLFHKGEQANDEAAASAELGKEEAKGITGICDDEARGVPSGEDTVTRKRKQCDVIMAPVMTCEPLDAPELTLETIRQRDFGLMKARLFRAMKLETEQSLPYGYFDFEASLGGPETWSPLGKPELDLLLGLKTLSEGGSLSSLEEVDLAAPPMKRIKLDMPKVEEEFPVDLDVMEMQAKEDMLQRVEQVAKLRRMQEVQEEDSLVTFKPMRDFLDLSRTATPVSVIDAKVRLRKVKDVVPVKSLEACIYAAKGWCRRGPFCWYRHPCIAVQESAGVRLATEEEYYAVVKKMRPGCALEPSIKLVDSKDIIQPKIWWAPCPNVQRWGWCCMGPTCIFSHSMSQPEHVEAGAENATVDDAAVQEALEIKKLRDAAALYKALGAKADTLEAQLRSDAVPAAEEGGLAAVAQLKREPEQSLSACSRLEVTEGA